jgi:hypothetical protein
LSIRKFFEKSTGTDSCSRYKFTMATLLNPVVELPLPPHQLEELVEKAKDFALLHGKNIIVAYER